MVLSACRARESTSRTMTEASDRAIPAMIEQRTDRVPVEASAPTPGTSSAKSRSRRVTPDEADQQYAFPWTH